MVLGDEDRGALLLEINGDLIVKKGRPNGLFCVLEYPAKNIGWLGDKTIVVKTTRRLKRRTICIGRRGLVVGTEAGAAVFQFHTFFTTSRPLSES